MAVSRHAAIMATVRSGHGNVARRRVALSCMVDIPATARSGGSCVGKGSGCLPLPICAARTGLAGPTAA
ncbi:hypothetical protein [Novacetimonas cocois]|uniref:Uncharacterized protein n=1 Tax=Novacetimonas cocois TaxID=1747507 RepID=A0A365YWE4_9PROT|nr:hypothetical protein [Novacetimonas cocois]RBM06738.1 hypothetical protein NJLHNGOC_08755 [Novacetimonas cocois]